MLCALSGDASGHYIARKPAVGRYTWPDTTCNRPRITGRAESALTASFRRVCQPGAAKRPRINREDQGNSTRSKAVLPRSWNNPPRARQGRN
ncbi:hypothetical protein ACFQ4C_08810 [Larkinella insperata]|uniref:Uncharacterized protein n=1 Tax=Larkinella insperata TaxID=332158 RepID=A0ABW3Q626_9BACT